MQALILDEHFLTGPSHKQHVLVTGKIRCCLKTCSLDSRDPNFHLLFIAYGRQDEQYSRRLSGHVDLHLSLLREKPGAEPCRHL
jgi:hypothetical protein